MSATKPAHALGWIGAAGEPPRCVCGFIGGRGFHIDGVPLLAEHIRWDGRDPVVVRIDSHRARHRAKSELGDNLGSGHWRSPLGSPGDYYIVGPVDALKLDGIPSIRRAPRVKITELHPRWSTALAGRAQS